MGAAGAFVNFFALVFLTIGIVFICFPTAPHPDAASFNFTVVIFGGVTMFALVYYFAYGRRYYTSPRSRITHANATELIEIGAGKSVGGQYDQHRRDF